MRLTRSDILALIATAAGIVGLVFSFGLSDAVVPIASLFVLALGATVIAARYVQAKRPEFSVSEMEKTLTLRDSKGSESTFTRRMKAVTNISGLREVWTRNIAADGEIRNFQVDGQPVSPADVVTQLGLKHVRKTFRRPLRKGETIDVVFSYEMLNSFVRPSEALIHLVNHQTERLRLTVRFPEERPFVKAQFTEMYGGAKPLVINDITEGGQEVNVEMDRPKLGASYELRWQW